MLNFKFADIGEGIHEGKVFEIFVKEGDKVKDGDNLLSVETDKITAEIPSPANGVIKKILVTKGQVIHVGEDMFVIDDGSADSAAPAAAKNEEKPKQEKAQEATEQVSEAGSGASVVGEVKISNDALPSFFGAKKKSAPANSSFSSSSAAASVPHVSTPYQSGTAESRTELNGSKVLATPVARAMANQNGINIHEVHGTGPNGRVLKDDVSNHSSPPQKSEKTVSAPAASSSSDTKQISRPQIKPTPGQQQFFGETSEKRVPVSQIRTAIAKAMTTSWKNVAYTNLVNEVEMDNLMQMRNRVKTDLESQGIKITYLAYITKAFAKALEEFPEFNSTFDEAKNEIVYKRTINVGIAVDTPNGLFVPVIQNTNHQGVTAIAQEITRLAGLARNNKLGMKEISGGTFSITNFGSVGSLFGVPVIKYPELAIAGIGTITKRPKFNDKNELVAGNFMNITVAADHRWIDGANIGRFATRVKALLENPELLLH